jgi:hypothetical protein
MKYVLLFVETEQFTSDMAAMSPSERERAYDRVNEWFADHADKLRGGSKLKAPETATTVRLDRGEPVITDGPFVEGKEVVSGYVEIEVADLDEALKAAKTSPAPTERSCQITMTDITQLKRALIARVLDRDAMAPQELRRATFDNAGLDEPTGTLMEKVVYHADTVTDDDVAAVRAAGLSEDQIFEIVVCAAIGQANRQYEAALAALAAATGQTGDRR